MKNFYIFILLYVILSNLIQFYAYKFSCIDGSKNGPCFIYVNPYGKTFQTIVLPTIAKSDNKIRIKIVQYLQLQREIPKCITNLNQYIRHKLTQSMILDVCYALNIYTKCKPKTFLVLSPKIHKETETIVRNRSNSFNNYYHRRQQLKLRPVLIRSKSFVSF
ncbi:Hypothetical protein SRAE_2000448700 [Strongyloides ratti]|uniref:Uncharacterized protein n=1 Tax=Strongyloides ratti TaxID=34506 RepID=A0A090LQJ6_STRRB|nr:Hypothetical protein SRAE_2000448700 [Strongyloides ratti]CEF69841.1 Hypothetical protein SRAE_2000448700 [Strongyloides ratti]